MIRLGLRLAVSGARGARARLALMSAGVAFGVAVLLAMGSVVPASLRRSDRVDRRDSPATLTDEQAARTPHLLWSVQKLEAAGAHTITVISVASSGPGAPAALGTSRTPTPHTVLVSPALGRALRHGSHRVRVPGPVVGELGPAALASGHDLVMMVGWDYATLHAADRDARTVTEFDADLGLSGIGRGLDVAVLLVSLPFVAATLFIPLLVFIGAAARVGARRREERLAALRLTGATPGQVRVLAAVEAASAGVIGVVVGLGLSAVGREAVVHAGAAFRPDFTPPFPWVLFVVLVTPVLAALSAVLALRRVQITPLGVTRRARPRRVTPMRWWPFVLGWALLLSAIAWRAVLGNKDAGIVGAAGFVIVMLGLVVAGPGVVQALAGWLVERARRASTLLAARRLDADPLGGFRAVNGLVIAVFIATVVMVLVPSRSAQVARHKAEVRRTTHVPRPVARPDLEVSAPSSSLDLALRDPRFLSRLAPVPLALPFPAPVPPAALAAVRVVKGVEGVVAVYDLHNQEEGGTGAQVGGKDHVVVASCATFVRVVRAGGSACQRSGIFVDQLQHGGDVGALRRFGLDDGSGHVASLTAPIAGVLPSLGAIDVDAGLLVPPELAPRAVLDHARIAKLLVRTDGTRAAAERVGRVVAAATPGMDVRLASARSRVAPTAGVVWALAFVLILAACGLAVTTIDGVAERRRSLATLRAAGTPAGVLRRAAMLEVGAPLVAVTVLGAVNGLAVAVAVASAAGEPIVVSWLSWLSLLVVPALLGAVWLAVTALALPAIGRASALRWLRTT